MTKLHKYELIKKIKGKQVGFIATGLEIHYYKCALYPDYWKEYTEEVVKSTCKWCDTPIKGSKRRSYCSEECGKKANALNAALNYHKNKNERD